MIKKILGGTVSIVILFAVIASCSSDSSDSPSNTMDTETGKPKQPDLTINASEISKAFQGNEAKAQLTYGDKVINVTGKVKGVDLDFSDNPVIKLKGHGDVQNMGINNDGKMTDVTIGGIDNAVAAEINSGETHSFTCSSVTEVMGGANLRNCVLAKPIK